MCDVDKNFLSFSPPCHRYTHGLIFGSLPEDVISGLSLCVDRSAKSLVCRLSLPGGAGAGGDHAHETQIARLSNPFARSLRCRRCAAVVVVTALSSFPPL